MTLQTKISFYKSYSKMGWWAVRTPANGDWTGHRAEAVGFGVTTNQAERDLLSREGSVEMVDGIAA